MASKLTQAKRDEMFAAYCKNQCVESVAKICGVTGNTVYKYRRKDNWLKRLSTVRVKAERKLDNELGKRLAENLKIVRFAKAKLVNKIKAGKDKSSSTYRDLDTMIRAEEFLLGGPDSRLAVGRFDQMSDEELKEKLREVKRIQGDI